jgi:hypothetical protein
LLLQKSGLHPSSGATLNLLRRQNLSHRGLLTVAFDERPAPPMAQIQIVARRVTRAARRSFDEAAAGEKPSQCAKPTDVSDAHSLFFLDRTAGV